MILEKIKPLYVYRLNKKKNCLISLSILVFSLNRNISIGTVDGGALRADGGTMYIIFNEQEAHLTSMAEKVKHNLGNRLLDGPGTAGMFL